jgi:REP element-mobilizing transposase RayT
MSNDSVPATIRQNNAWKSRKHYNDGIHQCRGYLPHFDKPDRLQFITTRLYDSLPPPLLQQARDEAATLKQLSNNNNLRKAIELALDKSAGACYLANPEVAAIIKDHIFRYEQVAYTVEAWVIMPNHIHMALRIMEDSKLSSIIKQFKGASAHAVNKLLQRSGSFWEKDYFDSYARNEQDEANIIRYIENNPVKAGLCQEPEDWQYSSAGTQKSFR